MESEFLQHCQKGYLEGVNDCLFRGVDVNTKGEGMSTRIYACRAAKVSAPMVACDYGHPDIVSRLVQVPGLDINYRDEIGDTAVEGKHSDYDCSYKRRQEQDRNNQDPFKFSQG